MPPCQRSRSTSRTTSNASRRRPPRCLAQRRSFLLNLRRSSQPCSRVPSRLCAARPCLYFWQIRELKKELERRGKAADEMAAQHRSLAQETELHQQQARALQQVFFSSKCGLLSCVLNATCVRATGTGRGVATRPVPACRHGHGHDGAEPRADREAGAVGARQRGAHGVREQGRARERARDGERPRRRDTARGHLRGAKLCCAHL